MRVLCAEWPGSLVQIRDNPSLETVLEDADIRVEWNTLRELDNSVIPSPDLLTRYRMIPMAQVDVKCGTFHMKLQEAQFKCALGVFEENLLENPPWIPLTLPTAETSPLMKHRTKADLVSLWSFTFDTLLLDFGLGETMEAPNQPVLRVGLPNSLIYYGSRGDDTMEMDVSSTSLFLTDIRLNSPSLLKDLLTPENDGLSVHYATFSAVSQQTDIVLTQPHFLIIPEAFETVQAFLMNLWTYTSESLARRGQKYKEMYEPQAPVSQDTNGTVTIVAAQEPQPEVDVLTRTVIGITNASLVFAEQYQADHNKGIVVNMSMHAGIDYHSLTLHQSYDVQVKHAQAYACVDVSQPEQGTAIVEPFDCVLGYMWTPHSVDVSMQLPVINAVLSLEELNLMIYLSGKAAAYLSAMTSTVTPTTAQGRYVKASDIRKSMMQEANTVDFQRKDLAEMEQIEGETTSVPSSAGGSGSVTPVQKGDTPQNSTQHHGTPVVQGFVKEQAKVNCVGLVVTVIHDLCFGQCTRLDNGCIQLVVKTLFCDERLDVDQLLQRTGWWMGAVP